MNTPLNPQQLTDVKNNLLAKREKLKKELKTKHTGVYRWLIEHNIDLDNLHKYSKNIAAALLLTNRLLTTNPQMTPVPTPTYLANHKNGRDISDLEDLSPEELARRVWNLYGKIIDKVAKKYDLDPQLIFATIMTESEGNPRAYRYESQLDDASYGLGQTLYSTAQSLGFYGSPEEIYRPDVAIDLIGRYHKNTIDTYGSLAPEQMTTVYNTGTLFGCAYPGHLDRFADWYYNYSDTRNLAKKEVAKERT